MIRGFLLALACLALTLSTVPAAIGASHAGASHPSGAHGAGGHVEGAHSSGSSHGGSGHGGGHGDAPPAAAHANSPSPKAAAPSPAKTGGHMPAAPDKHAAPPIHVAAPDKGHDGAHAEGRHHDGSDGRRHHDHLDDDTLLAALAFGGRGFGFGGLGFGWGFDGFGYSLFDRGFFTGYSPFLHRGIFLQHPVYFVDDAFLPRFTSTLHLTSYVTGQKVVVVDSAENARILADTVIVRSVETLAPGVERIVLVDSGVVIVVVTDDASIERLTIVV